MATQRTKESTTRKKGAKPRRTSANKAGHSSTNRAPGATSRAAGSDGNSAVGSRAFKKAEREANKVLKDPAEAKKLRAKAEKKAKANRVDLGDALTDLQTLMRLMTAYTRGDYRELPKTTMLAAVGAVIYFVNPIDLIPDVIPGVGYLDDISVLFFVVKAIQRDLDDFRTWEAEQKTPKRKRPRKHQGGSKTTASGAKRTSRSAPKSTSSPSKRTTSSAASSSKRGATTSRGARATTARKKPSAKSKGR